MSWASSCWSTRRTSACRCLETLCRTHRRGQCAQSGFRAGSVGTIWNQHRQDIARSFGHPQNPASPESGGAGGEDHRQTGLPACVIYFSLSFSGDSGSGGHHRDGKFQQISYSLERENRHGQCNDYSCSCRRPCCRRAGHPDPAPSQARSVDTFPCGSGARGTKPSTRFILRADVRGTTSSDSSRE